MHRLAIFAGFACATLSAQRASLVIQTGHTAGVETLAFSPDGRLLASASTDAKIKLWDTTTGLELRELPGHQYGTTVLAFSPDGRTLLTGGASLRFIDVATGSESRRLANESRGRAAVSVDFRLIATSDSGQIRLWDAATGAQVRSFENNDAFVETLAFSP